MATPPPFSCVICFNPVFLVSTVPNKKLKSKPGKIINFKKFNASAKITTRQLGDTAPDQKLLKHFVQSLWG